MADFHRRQRTTITVNGQTYTSVDEMPPEVRRQYEQVMSLMADQNNDGVPDVLEGQPPGESTVVSQVTTTTAGFKLGPGGLRELQSMGTSSLPTPATPTPTPTPSREDGGGGGGITVHITWSTVLALLVVAAIGIAIWWMTSGRAG